LVAKNVKAMEMAIGWLCTALIALALVIRVSAIRRPTSKEWGDVHQYRPSRWRTPAP
jgi:hypothetical protein